MYKIGFILFGLAVAFLVIKLLSLMNVPQPAISFITNVFIVVWASIILVVLLLKFKNKGNDSQIEKDQQKGI